jgi:outer membrane protein OmpA-like peptidoglycan-associated protein/uncharacterized protein YegL
MKPIYLLLLLLLFSFFAFSQKKATNFPPVQFTSVSPDGRYFLVDYSAKRFLGGEFTYRNVAKVYHVKSRKYIARLEFMIGQEPQSFEFSPDNKKVLVKAGKQFLVFDIKRRKVQKTFEKTTAVGFVDGNLAHVEDGAIKLIGGDSNEELKQKYVGFGRTSLSKIYESPDFKYIIAKNSNSFFLWSKLNSRLAKRIVAERLTFSPDHSEIYAISYRSRLCYLSVYDSKTLQLKSESSSELFKSYFDFNFSDGSSVSPNGKYVAFSAKKLGDTKSLGIYKIQTGKKLDSLAQVFELDSTAIEGEYSNLVKPYKWLENGKELLVKIGVDRAKIYNLETQTLTDTLLYFGKFKKFQISPDGKFLISFSAHRSSSLITVHFPTRPNARTIFVDGVNFLSFDPKSEFLFVEKKDKTYGFLLLSELAEGKPNFNPKVYPFSTVPFIPGTEEMIAEDAPPPLNYEHTYLKEFRHISELQENSKLQLHFKTTVNELDTVRMEAHLMDSEGNYYYGASTEMWKDWWCNVRVKRKGETEFVAVDSFNIEEVNELDTLPIAFALVMDHSGSMGDERTVIVQESAQQLIRNKRPQDTVALVKYDSRVGVESDLATDTTLLLRRLQVEGLERFGGATALVDAAHEAVELLKKAEDYEKKAIVIFTDGLENSSVLTKAELIEEANELGVQIYTVGFGSEIDTAYLRDLAEATSGGNYRIYQTPDFLRIFQDVYQRMRNYYTISFPADSIGEFETIVDLCLPTGKDSLVFYFENDTLIPKITIEEIPEDGFPEDDYTDFEKIPKKGDVKLLHVNFKFGTTDITETSFPEVQKAIDYLKKYPKIIVKLRGHTDYVGTEHFNLKLSRQRASAIKHKMTENGIDSHRIKTLGLGEAEPIAPNDTEEGRALNRRTEFVILEE